MMTAKQVEAAYPLSPVQEGMLFHTLYAPQAGTYVTQHVLLLEQLKVAEFQRAWQEMVARHPVLRTAVAWKKVKRPLQLVGNYVEIPWQILDWRRLSPAAQAAQLEAFLAAERQQGFVLSRAPLMRCTLIRVGEESYQFIWSHHHLLLDGWSVSILQQEIVAYYEAFCRGHTITLPVPPSYEAYISWLYTQNNAEAEEFWRQMLADVKEPTPLTQRHLPPMPSSSGSDGVQTTALSHPVVARLQALAHRHQLTLTTLFYGAWAILLHRYSGHEDVLFGVTMAGRPPELPHIEAMVGLFINTLPLRVTVPTSGNTISWLQALQRSQWQMQQYHYTPLVQVQAYSQVPGNQPLFESLVVVENYPQPDGRFENLIVRQNQTINLVNYPLMLVAELGDAANMRLNYDRSRFTSEQMTRLLGHLETILNALPEKAETHPPAALPLLTQAERAHWLSQSVVPGDPPEAAGVHTLVERQARLTPERIALTHGHREVSYARLNDQANRLAFTLQKRGVKPGTRVGICVERSPQMVIALLAVMKIGGVYVPLDPDYPAARCAYILADAGVTVLVTQSHFSELFSDYHGEILFLDQTSQWMTDGAGFEAAQFLPEQPIYIMYTSGSTGKPKGVLICHRSVVHYLSFITRHYQISGNDIILQIPSICFDGSVRDIFAPLTVGACVRLVDRDTVKNPAALLTEIDSTAVTVILSIVPPLLNQLLAAGAAHPVASRSLRLILVGGQALPQADRARVRTVFGDQVRFINQYGPTETTITVSYHDTRVEHETQGIVPIGRPTPSTQLLVLDPTLNLLPAGVPGELYIGGIGLAWGYLNRPGLTAERFIPHPFGEPGERLYRSGDRVSWRPDGVLEFWGRMDRQVKIRGFRVELGEIEAVLATHPAVQTAVVQPDPEGADWERLIAYVVPVPATPPAVEALRHHLAEALPPYMVPAVFVILDALPLTPQGKVDWQALPVPGAAYPRPLDKPFTPPRTATEEVLVQLWSEALRLERVGVHDDFFALGGHSLLAARLAFRIAAQFQVALSLPQFFEGATVARLATILDQSQARPDPETAVAPRPLARQTQQITVSEKGELFISPPPMEDLEEDRD